MEIQGIWRVLGFATMKTKAALHYIHTYIYHDQ